MDKIVHSLPVEANANQFWGAARIYTEKPHIVNRRLCGVANLWIGVCHDEYCRSSLISHMSNVMKVRQGAHINSYNCDIEEKQVDNNSESEDSEEQVQTLKKILVQEGFTSTSDNLVESEEEISGAGEDKGKEHLSNVSEATVGGKSIPWQKLAEVKDLKVAIIRKVLPRQLKRYSSLLEVVVIDGRMLQVSFFPEKTGSTQSISPRIHYSFRFTNHDISLTAIMGTEEEIKDNDPNVTWLKQNVLPKLVKWASEVEEDGNVEDRGSLKLVDVQEYNSLYQKLKIKYGQPLVEMWPEVTDPTKFVFEDVAIATYLILLWQQEREKKGQTEYQTFADLGCGNGLLVYILTMEGYKGIGIDLKKRNIWDMFPENVNLKEGVVEPSDKNLFPEFDWLIGNHSDELTPWLPVIAAKSKFTTRFFVIPCCAHDFDCKYRRKTASKSQYSEYLDYVKEVGDICGFEMWQDKLRIPSTKRICLIGQERTYVESEMPRIFKAVEEFIRIRNEANANSLVNQASNGKHETSLQNNARETLDSELWSNNFKAREAIQPVRNCTKLDQTVKEDLISTVVGILMEKKHLVEVPSTENSILKWDRGGSIVLGDLAKRMSPRQLSALKNECGGLQTFLRNHKHIFSTLKGEVSLQVPSPTLMGKVPKNRVKTKQCWFHSNHAQGCPLPSTLCVYAHGQDDLQNNQGP